MAHALSAPYCAPFTPLALFDLQSDAGEGHPTPMAENAPGSPVAAVTLGCQPGRHPPPHKISLPPSL